MAIDCINFENTSTKKLFCKIGTYLILLLIYFLLFELFRTLFKNNVA